MTLIGLIVLLVLVGVGLYLVSLIPMDTTIKTIIKIVVIVVVVLYIVEALGLLNLGPTIRLH